jgi:hypothetical protein
MTLPSHRILIISTLILALGATAGIVVLRNHSAADATENKAADSLFSYDAGKPSTWWRQGPVSNTSLLLFKQDENCFASVDLRNGTPDEAADSSHMGAPTGSLDTRFTVGAQPHKVVYTLHAYGASEASDAGQLQSGRSYKTQVLGYVPLSGKYIRAQAYCSDDTTLAQIGEVFAAMALKAD